MKKIFAIGFIALYLLGFILPVIILAEFAINYKYITEEVCVQKDIPNNSCKGSCYLEPRLERSLLISTAASGDASRKNTDFQIFLPLGFLEFTYRITPPFPTFSSYSSYNCELRKFTGRSLYHPPEHTA